MGGGVRLTPVVLARSTHSVVRSSLPCVLAQCVGGAFFEPAGRKSLLSQPSRLPPFRALVDRGAADPPRNEMGAVPACLPYAALLGQRSLSFVLAFLAPRSHTPPPSPLLRSKVPAMVLVVTTPIRNIRSSRKRRGRRGKRGRQKKQKRRRNGSSAPRAYRMGFRCGILGFRCDSQPTPPSPTSCSTPRAGCPRPRSGRMRHISWRR
ncbi:hypothetical protein C8F04DRAFT_129733 [Mycena alexandri]|uniref:Uncharacterized protein n=1 Tax=Mycena alexandri TaxID=1745969 RepID=A0AAD6TA97_9AGAR|nr:hypothetical protein C8F04DRAFT_129733 [Mycena alexandri]